MRNGILKFFYRKTGFGFLEDVETGEQFFVSYRNLPVAIKRKRIEENTPVTFEVGEDARTPEEIAAGRLPLALNIQLA